MELKTARAVFSCYRIFHKKQLYPHFLSINIIILENKDFCLCFVLFILKKILLSFSSSFGEWNAASYAGPDAQSLATYSWHKFIKSFTIMKRAWTSSRLRNACNIKKKGGAYGRWISPKWPKTGEAEWIFFLRFQQVSLRNSAAGRRWWRSQMKLNRKI